MVNEELEDICKQCKGSSRIEDKPPMCGEESALFYALHKDKSVIRGKYQKINEVTKDVMCLYK